MNYLIWHNAKHGTYNYGTEMDLNIHESFSGDQYTVLYEMDDSELFLIKKIVSQLNAARIEQNNQKVVLR